MIQPGSRVIVHNYWLFEINDIGANEPSTRGTVLRQVSTDEYLDRLMSYPNAACLASQESTVRDQRAWEVQVDSGKIGFALESQLWPEDGVW